MKTIILAGGYGTRLQPITAERPKSLLPVAGKPIIEYILSATESLAGAPPFISTNKRFLSAFRKWQRNSPFSVKIITEPTMSESEKLGTVGSLNFLVRKKRIRDDLLVIAGDNIFEFDLKDFVNSFQDKFLIAIYDIKDKEKIKRKYGNVEIDEKGRIIDFIEKPSSPKTTLVSTACYIFPKRVLDTIPEFLSQTEKGKDAMGYFCSWLLKEKKIPIQSFVFKDAWFDIGSRVSYLAANRYYLKGESYSGKKSEIINSKVTDSIIFDEVVLQNCEITSCVIDDYCRISNLKLKECLIGKGTIIKGIPGIR
ncbi:MAG: NTP transferase domain-containing protein [Candidatus Omnitrophica bacterium]|nr:NTP transferase domain-containing protein [Candidatus Omnitrophota bacterium]